MVGDLTKVIEKAYQDLNVKSLNIHRGNATSFIDFVLEKNMVGYAIALRGDVFVTNEINILPNQKDEELYGKIIQKNEIIAKELKCSRMNVEALCEMDKGWLEKLNYNFEDGKYVGVKKLK